MKRSYTYNSWKNWTKSHQSQNFNNQVGNKCYIKTHKDIEGTKLDLKILLLLRMNNYVDYFLTGHLEVINICQLKNFKVWNPVPTVSAQDQVLKLWPGIKPLQIVVQTAWPIPRSNMNSIAFNLIMLVPFKPSNTPDFPPCIYNTISPSLFFFGQLSNDFSPFL